MTATPEMYERFKDAPWFKQYPITVGGVGGIGSWLSLLLARGGHSLILYDMDNVELQNMGGQLYAAHHVGKPKTSAVKETAAKFANNESVQVFGKFTEESFVTDITFSAFDNMEARKMMSEKWYAHQMAKITSGAKRKPDEVNIFIDGRMEAETFIIYAVDSPERYKRYQEELFDDSLIPNAPCSFRATSHNPAILAGNMVALLNNMIANKLRGRKIRNVPYKIEYELPTFTLTVHD